MSDHGDVESIAAELYAGHLDGFVAARSARAKQTDDRELAAAIRAVRKPSVAAWVVNLFAAERADRLRQALLLAAQLREAQEELDAATLSQLGTQRRALTNELAAEAAALAKAQRIPVTAATLDAVRRTISAAFFDPDAAAAVASGRLVRDLVPGERVDLASAVGGGAPAQATPSLPVGDEVALRRQRRHAQQARRDVEQRHARAQRVFDASAREVEAARGRTQQLAARIAEVENELTRLRSEQARAQEAAAAAAARRDAAGDELKAAQREIQGLPPS